MHARSKIEEKPVLTELEGDQWLRRQSVTGAETPSTLVTPNREGPSRVRRELAAAVVKQPARVVLLADAPFHILRRLRRDVLVAQRLDDVPRIVNSSGNQRTPTLRGAKALRFLIRS